MSALDSAAIKVLEIIGWTQDDLNLAIEALKDPELGYDFNDEIQDDEEREEILDKVQKLFDDKNLNTEKFSDIDKLMEYFLPASGLIDVAEMMYSEDDFDDFTKYELIALLMVGELKARKCDFDTEEATQKWLEEHSEDEGILEE